MACYRLLHLLYFLMMLLVVVFVVTANRTPSPSPSPSRITQLNANRTGWDVLEDITSHIDFEDMHSIRTPDFYRYYLWEYYKGSSRSERLKAVKQMSQIFSRMAYIDNAIDLVGLILFGQKGHSILRSPTHHELELTLDEAQCLESTPKLFEKYCGLPSENHLKHMRSFENMCRFVLDKADIKEALIITCGMENIDPSVIDVGNPTIDVIPAPMHGSSQFCERFSLPGISRMKLQNFAKAYRLELRPPVPTHEEEYSKIQICFHRDASLRLCECGDREWVSIQKRLWSSLMSPYEQSFVDVKFSDGVSGSVTVNLDEVLQVFRYEFLVSGIGFLLLAPSFSKYLFYERVEQYVKWVMRVCAVQLLFMSSIDTPIAMVAVLFSLALNYVIISINAPMLFEKTKLWLWRTPKVGEERDRGLTTGSHFYLTFHKIPDRKNFSKKEWEEFTKKLTSESVGELASSPEFVDWVTKKNANTKVPLPQPNKKKLSLVVE